jgi:hypothetical protein
MSSEESSKRIMVAVPLPMVSLVNAAAARDMRSVSAYIVSVLAKAVKYDPIKHRGVDKRQVAHKCAKCGDAVWWEDCACGAKGPPYEIELNP